MSCQLERTIDLVVATRLAEAFILLPAVFPVGCIYRDRAIRAIERSGRRWRGLLIRARV